jgi:hypothetical protein
MGEPSSQELQDEIDSQRLRMVKLSMQVRNKLQVYIVTAEDKLVGCQR